MIHSHKTVAATHRNSLDPVVKQLVLGCSLASLSLFTPSMGIAAPIDLPTDGATLMIDGGDTVNATDVLVGNGGTATLTVTDSGSSLNASGNLTVGSNGGTGTLLLTDGATIDGLGWLVIGTGANSQGDMAVSGAGTSFTAGTNIAIGDYGGKGSLIINEDATFDLPNGSIYVGAHNSEGRLLIDGAGTVVSVDGNMSTGCVQTTADCRVDITNGAKLLMTGDETGGFISTGPGQNGTVRLSGAGTEWSGIRWFYVGYNQDSDESPNIGTLIIEDGAVARRDLVVDPTTMAGSVGSFAAGVSAEDTGNVIVRGAGSELSSIYNMYINFSGTGNFEVYDGGTIAAGSSVPVNDNGTLKTVLGGLRFYSDKGTLNIGGTVDGPARGAGFIESENIIFRTPVDGISGGTLVLNHTNDDYEISSNLISFGSTALSPPEDIGFGITERGGKIVAVAGDTTFSGNGSEFYGLLDLRGGVVRVTGSLGPLSEATIGDKALLTGTGSVGSVAVTSGGVIGGGSREQVGTLSLAGDLMVETGGDVRVRFDSGSANDIIAVIGDATFADGSLLTVEKLSAGQISLGDRHLVMTIDGDRTGSLTGRGDMVLSNFYELTISYDQDVPDGQTQVFLDPVQYRAFADVEGLTRNERAVAKALQDTSIKNPVVNAVGMLSNDVSAARAYEQLSGVVYTDVSLAVAEEISSVSDVLLARANEVSYRNGAQLWANLLGKRTEYDNESREPSVSANFSGLLAGLDYKDSTGVKAGAAIGVSNGSTNVSDKLGDADTNAFHAGAYAGYTFDGASILGGANVAVANVNSSRRVSIGEFGDHLEGDYTQSAGQLFVEASYKVMLSKKMSAEPFARYSHVMIGSSDLKEAGGAAALSGETESEALDYATLGLRVGAEMTDEARWGLNASGGYRRLIAGGAVTGSYELVGSPSFEVDSSAPARDVGFVGVELEGRLTDAASMSVNYSGNFGDGYTSQSIGAMLSWRL